jgi:hypothetical protein
VIQSILDGNAQKYKVDATDIELQARYTQLCVLYV